MTNTDETQTTPTNPTTTSFWHRKPTLWVGGGLAAAALLAGGVGLGTAVADGDDDDRPVATQPVNNDADDDSPVPVGGGSTYGATDASDIAGILASAAKASNGTPTSMEANRDGSWSVDFEASNRDETTVLVAADGSASIVRTDVADGDDANDPAPAGTLTAQTIADAVKAALREEQGTIIGIDLDDDPAEAYSVQVLTSNGSEPEIDLSTGFDVTKVDND
ncbi:hypothetical protein GCM10022234_04010 [Aeromicrobium panaciterrae]|uniref:PepSY domain-containing protein n=1 Tax=Aeromicrobium panaciterrae TaxID=363861 RepID=UPI0031CE2356